MATRRRNPTKRRRTNQKGCCKKQKCSHNKARLTIKRGGCGACMGGGMRGGCGACMGGGMRGGCGACMGGGMRGGGNPLGFLDPFTNSSMLSNITNGAFTVPQPYSPWW